MKRIAITPGQLSLQQDESAFGLAVEALVRRAAELAVEGVESILLREKTLAPRRRAAVIDRLADALAGTATRLSVALPLAEAAVADAAAHGIHLGSIPDTAAAHRLLDELLRRRRAAVTAAAHSVRDVERLRCLGLSALLFAPVYGKRVNGHEVAPGVGVDVLRLACSAAGPLPIYALGGVTEANAEACLQAGAAGIAAIRMFTWPA